MLLFILLMMYAAACSIENSAARKARKADEARQKEMVQLQRVRVELPCDPVKIIEGKTVYIPGDSIPYPVYVNGKEVIKYAQCPPSKVRVDTFVKIDQAALKAVRDSADHWAYLFGVATDSYADLSKDNKDLKDAVSRKNNTIKWFIIINSIGAIIAGVSLYLKLKPKFL